MQSNIFFFFYFFNSIVPFAIDFSIQFYRNQRLSNSALCLIILFAINCFLWLDFNVQMLFKKQPQDSVAACRGVIQFWAMQGSTKLSPGNCAKNGSSEECLSEKITSKGGW